MASSKSSRKEKRKKKRKRKKEAHCTRGKMKMAVAPTRDECSGHTKEEIGEK